jgi:hypothetical protein
MKAAERSSRRQPDLYKRELASDDYQGFRLKRGRISHLMEEAADDFGKRGSDDPEGFRLKRGEAWMSTAGKDLLVNTSTACLIL